MRLQLKIINEKGLHARASARFVEIVERFDASAIVSKDGMSVSGDSIMGLMMLAASKGCHIDIKISGKQKVTLAHSLTELVNNYFHERH